MASRSSGNPNDFCLPDLGEGLEEAELIEWDVHVGQRVEENEILAKMETAKALVEVPSPRAGVIAELHGKPGSIIKVGSPLVTYLPAEESPAAPEPRKDAGTVVGDLSEAAVSQEEGKVLAAPAVRKLARDSGVDLNTVNGTGIGGRITSRDVQEVVARTDKPTPSERPRSAFAESPPPAIRSNGDAATRIPFRGIRKTIAEHLRHSVQHAVHFTVMDEADVTSLETLRRKLMTASNEKVTLLPFIAFAVCRVLSGSAGDASARLNSTVDDEKQEIVQHRAVHLGIATETDSGLMVPVIRDADRMGVLEIGRQIAALARAARDRSITAERLTGSTFTLSNYGAYGGRFGTPIINYPEAAILGIGRAREDVVVRDGMLGVGKLLPLSMSCDHRVIDGATAATALAKIIRLLQHPQELLPG